MATQIKESERYSKIKEVILVLLIFKTFPEFNDRWAGKGSFLAHILKLSQPIKIVQYFAHMYCTGFNGVLQCWRDQNECVAMEIQFKKIFVETGLMSVLSYLVSDTRVDKIGGFNAYLNVISNGASRFDREQQNGNSAQDNSLVQLVQDMNKVHNDIMELMNRQYPGGPCLESIVKEFQGLFSKEDWKSNTMNIIYNTAIRAFWSKTELSTVQYGGFSIGVIAGKCPIFHFLHLLTKSLVSCLARDNLDVASVLMSMIDWTSVFRSGLESDPENNIDIGKYPNIGPLKETMYSQLVKYVLLFLLGKYANAELIADCLCWLIEIGTFQGLEDGFLRTMIVDVVQGIQLNPNHGPKFADLLTRALTRNVFEDCPIEKEMIEYIGNIPSDILNVRKNKLNLTTLTRDFGPIQSALLDL